MRLKQKIRSVLYAPKHIKPTDENIMGLLLPSLVGIVICMICLTGMTWAWFSASVTSNSNTIQSADYSVSLFSYYTPADNETSKTKREFSASPDGTINAPLYSYPGTHELTLTAGGNVKKGYCIIQIADKRYLKCLAPGESVKFTVLVEKDSETDVMVFPRWGENIPDEKYENLETDYPNEVIPSENAEQTYTVKEGDSLWKIVQSYDGISAEDIATYNSIENPNALQIGQVLNIPTSPQNAPESPMPEETQSSNTKAEESAHADGIDSSVSTTTTSVYQ